MGSEKYNLYWGDSHTNVHGKDVHYSKPLTRDRLKQIIKAAKEHLDFFPIAYYPFVNYEEKGLIRESCGDRDVFSEEWKIVQDVISEENRPGEFVTFLGYEWHGDRRRYGDHNVYYLNDYEPLDSSETLTSLYENLRKTKAIAIPHHTGYPVGQRGKDWNFHDDELSPFVEIYSSHGSSEGVNTPFPLYRNFMMGPRVSGGTVQEGLDRGYRLGIAASGDNHADYPGVWGRGLMAAYARELTRESLWDAFMNRRVYGVTGDRIGLEFDISGHMMGESFSSEEVPEIYVKVVGSHAIDRIEIIRNSRVIHSYCHSGKWDKPNTREPVRAKVRMECGWGPASWRGLEGGNEKVWNGALEVAGGRIISLEPCFTNAGQKMSLISGRRCDWTLSTSVTRSWPIGNQAIIFEIECPLKGEITVKLGSRLVTFLLEDILKRSTVIALEDEARRFIYESLGLSPDDIDNPGIYYGHSHRMLIHKAIPQQGYEVSLRYTDAHPRKGTNYYYIRVSQLNGQMAWSSPIWVNFQE